MQRLLSDYWEIDLPSEGLARGPSASTKLISLPKHAFWSQFWLLGTSRRPSVLHRWIFDFVSTGRLRACQEHQRACQPREHRSKPGFKPLTHSSQCDSEPSLTHRGPIPLHTHTPFNFACAALLSVRRLEKNLISFRVWEDSLTLAPKLEDSGPDTELILTGREMTALTPGSKADCGPKKALGYWELNSWAVTAAGDYWVWGGTDGNGTS